MLQKPELTVAQTFLNEKDWKLDNGSQLTQDLRVLAAEVNVNETAAGSRWDSIDLLQRIYDSICADSTFVPQSEPSHEAPNEASHRATCDSSHDGSRPAGLSGSTASKFDESEAKAKAPCSVKSCMTRVRLAVSQEDWGSAFEATLKYLSLAQMSPSTRRAGLLLGPSRDNECVSSHATASPCHCPLDDFAMLCASLFAYWPRVELPAAYLSGSNELWPELATCRCASDTNCDCHSASADCTLSCEGHSIRTICRALQTLRQSWSANLSLVERHAVKKLVFIACGVTLANSAAIEAFYPIFFRRAMPYQLSDTPDQAKDLTAYLARSGFLQGLAEIYIIVSAKHRQWWYMLTILASASETGKAIFGPILERIRATNECCKTLECRPETVAGIRVPTMAVVACLYHLCHSTRRETPLPSPSSVSSATTDTPTTHRDTEASADLEGPSSPSKTSTDGCCKLLGCVNGTEQKGDCILDPEIRNELFLCLLTLLLCRPYSDDCVVDCTWHHQLFQFPKPHRVTASFILENLRYFLEHYKPQRCGASIENNEHLVSLLDPIITTFVFKDDTLFAETYAEIFPSSSPIPLLPEPMSKDLKKQSLKRLWSMAKKSLMCAKRLLSIIDILSRVCETFVCPNAGPIPLEHPDTAVTEDGLSCAVARETLNELTGCRLTTAEVWLMKTIEAYEAEVGVPMDLPGLSGPRKRFDHVLNLSTFSLQCLMEHLICWKLPTMEVSCKEVPRKARDLSLVPMHLQEMLPSCFFTTVNKMTADHRDVRWLLGWRTLGLEIVAIGRVPPATLPASGRVIAPHLSTLRLVKSFVHLYTEAASPRAIHLLHRLECGRKRITPHDPLCLTLTEGMLPLSSSFKDVNSSFKAESEASGDALSDGERTTCHYRGPNDVSLKSLLEAALDSKFVLMADAAAQILKNKESQHQGCVFAASQKKALIELILDIYLATKHFTDAQEYLEGVVRTQAAADVVCCKNRLEAEDVEAWRAKIQKAKASSEAQPPLDRSSSSPSAIKLSPSSRHDDPPSVRDAGPSEDAIGGNLVNLLASASLPLAPPGLDLKNAAPELSRSAPFAGAKNAQSKASGVLPPLWTQNSFASQLFRRDPVADDALPPVDETGSGSFREEMYSARGDSALLLRPAEIGAGDGGEGIRKWKKNVGNLEDAAQAVTLFHQMRDSAAGIPDVSVANKIINCCVAAGELSHAEELFQILRTDAHSHRSKVRPDIVTGNIVLKSLAKWKPPKIDAMEQIFRELETDASLGGDGLVADQVTFNTLINAAVTAGSFAKAWEYFSIMKSRGIAVDGYTCSILMKQIGPSTRPELITEILTMLADLDPCDDPVLLSSMVDVYSRLRDFARLRAALIRYERRVPKPLSYAMATLVKGWGRCGDVQRAAMLWQTLEETPNLQLTQYLCSCGVDAFVTNGDLERGLAIYRKAVNAKIVVSDIQASHLIRVCTQRRRLDDALSIYKDMRQNAQQPCDVTYNNLMHLCVLDDKLETAVEILNDMSTNAKHMPDVVTYSTIIKGLCDRGAMKLAMQLFEEIPSRGVKPDIVAYNTLLEGFARAEQQVQVERLFARLLDNGVTPTCYTLTILIRFYGRRKLLKHVFELIETMPKLYDIRIDAYVYTATIAACTWNGRVDKAFQFLSEMRKSFDASSRTYRTLIAGCIKSQNWPVLRETLRAATEDHVVLAKRDVLSLTDLCHQWSSNSLNVRWSKSGLDGAGIAEIRQFLVGAVGPKRPS